MLSCHDLHDFSCGENLLRVCDFISLLYALTVNCVMPLYYNVSGGHLHVGEEWSACASREVLEETGLQVQYRPAHTKHISKQLSLRCFSEKLS